MDTAAKFSALPATLSDRKLKPATPYFWAVNSSAVPTFGQRYLTTDIGFRQAFQWVLIITDLKQAVIRADILDHFRLSVNFRTRTLIDPTTTLYVQGFMSTLPVSQMRPTKTASLCVDILPTFQPSQEAATWSCPSNTVWRTASLSEVHSSPHDLVDCR